MSFVAGMLKQTATYWALTAQTGYGDFTFATPVDLSVRWEDGKSLTVDGDGEDKPPIATVWTETAVVVGGVMYLGAKSTISGPQQAAPFTVPTAYRIRSVVAQVDTQGVLSHYEVTL